MQKKIISVFIVLAIAFVAFGISNFGWSEALAKKADDTGATPLGVKSIVDANNQFAIDLYKEINDGVNNIFFSPWSISTAMAMAYEGASGSTAEDIESVFYYPVDDFLRRSSYASMINNLNEAHGDYSLNTANAIWLQEDYPFLEQYKSTISDYYLGEVKNVDMKDGSGTASKINRWAAKNTKNKIKKIVQPRNFDAETIAVLTNAIYFKGEWVEQFDKDDTKEEDFTLISEDKIKTDMMNLRDDDLRFNYVETDGVQILEMPYKGEKISMLVLLPRTELTEMDKEMIMHHGGDPKTSSIEKLEETISYEKLNEWKSMMEERTVFIKMPKFKFETTYSLSDHLKNMGMEEPFIRGGADFSGMDGSKDIYIQEVLHKAYIDVYEEGTEAAAVTAIVIGATSMMPSFIEFHANHPFIFLLQEKSTGNILFMGKVNNPRQSTDMPV